MKKLKFQILKVRNKDLGIIPEEQSYTTIINFQKSRQDGLNMQTSDNKKIDSQIFNRSKPSFASSINNLSPLHAMNRNNSRQIELYDDFKSVYTNFNNLATSKGVIDQMSEEFSVQIDDERPIGNSNDSSLIKSKLKNVINNQR